MKSVMLFSLLLASFGCLFANSYEEVDSSSSQARSLIYGGTRVESESKYPYFAVVIASREDEDEGESNELCGGVLIARDVVLTYTDCIIGDRSRIRVILESVSQDDRDRQVIDAVDWMIDESEDNEDVRLGLIFLEEEVEGDIEPIKVSLDGSKPAMNENIITMGFGSVAPDDDEESPSNELSEFLNEVTLRVNSTAMCDIDYENRTLVDAQQFCADAPNAGPCVGDTGGPAIDETTGDLVGIVAFGQGCGFLPVVFTRVSGFASFLKDEVCGRDNADDPEWCDSPAPGGGGGGLGGFCFAGSSKVQVLRSDSREEEITMKELSIGDKVHTGNGIYESIYSFGHYSPSVKSDMLQIKTDSSTPLRLSPNHMVMTASKGAVPASQVRVGDELLTSSSSAASVQKIDNVIGRGMYAPFTPSGKIVVDGILASTYIAFEDSDGLEVVSGVKISHQWMAHAGSFPHRFICYYSNSDYCANEKYSSEGIADGVYESFFFYKNIFEMANNYGSVVHTLLLSAVMIALLTFTLMETMMMMIMNPLSMTTIIITITMLWLGKKNKKKTKTQ